MPFFGALTSALALVAPTVNLTSSRDTLSGSWGAVTGAYGYRVRYRRQSERPGTGGYDPITWEILVPYTKALSFTQPGALWTGLAYDVQVAALDANENPGPWATVQFTASTYLTPRLMRDNSDLSQTRTWFTGFGTVTPTRFATGGDNNGAYTRLVFADGSSVWRSDVPVQSSLGRKLVMRLKIKGTAGETIQYGCKAGSDNVDRQITLDGTWQVLAPYVRPAFTASARALQININTFGGSTARTVQVEYYDCTLDDDASPGPYVLTTIDTLQEALDISSLYTVSTDPTNPTVIATHHQSTSVSIPAVDQTAGAVWYQGHATGPGDVVRCITGFPVYLAVTNARLWCQRPNIAGASMGKPVKTAYASATVIENNFIRGGTGILVQYRRPVASIASGIFAGGNFRTRYNRMRDLDGRLSDGAGGYIRSNYSNIQTRPPGAGVGYTIANFQQYLGQNGETAETIPPITEYNEGASRTGCTGEDSFSHLQIRGNGNGYPFDTGLPYKTSHNLGAWTVGTYDFLWLDANDISKKWSFSGVKTTFGLIITVGAASAGATSVPISGALNLNIASIPSGTVLTSAAGKSVTLSAAINKNTSGSFSVVSVPSGGLTAGDTFTFTVQDHPGGASGTTNLMSDGYVGDGTVAGNFEQQSRYGLAVQNLGIGPSTLHSTQAGLDILHVTPESVNTPYLIDGTIQHDGARPGYGFIGSYSASAAQRKDAGGTFRNVWGRNGIVGMVGSGVAVADARGQLSAALLAGATSLTLSVAWVDPVLPGASITFRDSNNNALGTATVGAAGVAAGVATWPITGLSGAISTGMYVWVTAGDSPKGLLTRDNGAAGADQSSYAYAMRRWQTWRDTATALGLTIGPT